MVADARFPDSQWAACRGDSAGAHADRDVADRHYIRVVHYAAPPGRGRGWAPPEAPRRRTISRGAGVSGAGTLVQRQGFERLCATAVLHALRRGDRTARRIRRGGKGRDGWNDVLGLLASTLLAVSSAAATVAARRRRNPHGPTRHCRGGRTEAAC